MVDRTAGMGLLGLMGLLMGLMLVGCSARPVLPPDSSVPIPPREAGVVATNLAVPWAMTRLPGGTALVTSRDTGIVNRVADGQPPEVVGSVAGVAPGGEGGLLGIAVEPGPNPRSVYVYYTSATDNRVARMSWDGRRLSDQEVVLTGIPKESFHDGGRIAFGPDGHLYIATGDAGNPDLAQDPASLAGKILRVDRAGRAVSANPDPESPVYSLGHRNVQGLAWDTDDRLWASEFGQEDVDELNLIQAGGNYGWPQCEGPCNELGVINPKATWSPTSTASPSGMAIVQGSAWIASLRGQVLYQVPLEGTEAGEPIAWFGGQYGRLRDVLAYDRNRLWVATNNTDGRGEPQVADDRIIAIQLPR